MNLLYVTGDSVMLWHNACGVEAHEDIKELRIIDNHEWAMTANNPEGYLQLVLGFGIS
jgi:hypothetical protein